MSIEAMKMALEALDCLIYDKPYAGRFADALIGLRTATQQAEAQPPVTATACGIPGMAKTTCPYCELSFTFEHEWPATAEPVLFIHPDTFAMNNAHVGAWKPGHELTGYIPLYTHPAPSVPDGPQWFTVAEHGLPEVGEEVVGGLWYTDPWLKPEYATSFMWGQCRVVDTKHRDFKDGKQWLTFGPSHNQITHWARLNPPSMLAAK